MFLQFPAFFSVCGLCSRPSPLSGGGKGTDAAAETDKDLNSQPPPQPRRDPQRKETNNTDSKTKAMAPFSLCSCFGLFFGFGFPWLCFSLLFLHRQAGWLHLLPWSFIHSLPLLLLLLLHNLEVRPGGPPGEEGEVGQDGRAHLYRLYKIRKKEQGMMPVNQSIKFGRPVPAICLKRRN